MKRYIPFLNGTAFMGMLAKRPDGVYGPEYAPDSDVDWVLASDVDALLTQCEEWIGGQLCPDDTGCANCKKGRELLAAIRAARGKA